MQAWCLTVSMGVFQTLGVGSNPTACSKRIHMHYKRKKSKRNVRCTLCTQLRWRGNSKSKKRISDLRNDDREKAERTTMAR